MERRSHTTNTRLRFLLISIALFLCLELAGRFWGFCDYPLYLENAHYEHIHQPSQNRLIYRNQFYTNEWSLRSKPLSPTDKIRILLAGDSILNGGNLTDQNALASTILENTLQKTYGPNIRILNLSGPNWGPDNIAAYLDQHGTDIQPTAIWLLTSSHDAFDAMQFESIIGKHPQYPTKQAPLAIFKVAQRLWHHFFKTQHSHQQQIENSAHRAFNPGFQQIHEWCLANNIPMNAYFHYSKSELENGKLHRGGLQILAQLDSLGVNYINQEKQRLQFDHFRDDLHYNAKGQRFLADQLLPVIEEQVKDFIK